MPNNLNQFDSLGQRRIKRLRTVLQSRGDQLSKERDHVTDISLTGNVETTEIEYLMEIEGETISDLSQVVGRCQEPKCGKYLTRRTMRSCFYCGKVNCVSCCRWDEKDERWVCRKCFRSLKWKRFWSAIGRLLIWPFVRRKEE